MRRNAFIFILIRTHISVVISGLKLILLTPIIYLFYMNDSYRFSHSRKINRAYKWKILLKTYKLNNSRARLFFYFMIFFWHSIKYFGFFTQIIFIYNFGNSLSFMFFTHQLKFKHFIKKKKKKIKDLIFHFLNQIIIEALEK